MAAETEERMAVVVKMFVCLCFVWRHLKKLKLLSIFCPIEEKKTSK